MIRLPTYSFFGGTGSGSMFQTVGGTNNASDKWGARVRLRILTLFGVLRHSPVRRELAHSRCSKHRLDDPLGMVLHEHFVAKSLRLEVRVKVIGNEPVVTVLSNGVEERVIVAISKHAGTHSLDRIGARLRSLFDGRGVVLVLVPYFIHIFREVSEQEALLLAGFFGDLN